MAETRRNIGVGLFVLAGLAALVVLVVLFGYGPGDLVAGRTYPIEIVFDDIGGVREGNLVTARGITIGRVAGIALRDPSRFDRGVSVFVAIDNEFELTDGSSAVATQQMIGQGRPPIEITPGPADARVLTAGAQIEGRVRRGLDTIFPQQSIASFESMVEEMGRAAEALTPVLREAEVILQGRSPEAVDATGIQGNVSSAVARFDAALKHFNDVLGDARVKSELRDTVANAYSMSEDGRFAMAEIAHAATESKALIADARAAVARIDTAVANVETRVGDLARTATTGLEKATEFFDNMSVLSRQVSTGEGNLGKLLNDAKLYESLLFTSERLAAAVEEFRLLIAEWRQGKIRIQL